MRGRKFLYAAAIISLLAFGVTASAQIFPAVPGGKPAASVDLATSPEGKRLGTIITPKHVHNMAWGDEDGKTLYLCARSGLYRMRLSIPGVRP
jgi:sugar lactone lactonase YvrE